MDVSGLLGIGGGWWGGAVRGAFRSVNRAFSSKATDSQAPAPQVSAPTVDGLVLSLREAGRALQSAFNGFATKTKPVYTTTLYTGLSSSATLSGLTARVAALPGYSILQTTEDVNTQTLPHSSSAALALDVLSPEAASVLRSAALGLDITSAQTASTKVSTAEMNTGFDTSYGSSSLSFTGPGLVSTSIGTLTGTYTGTGAAASATALTIDVTHGDTIGLVGVAEGAIDFSVKDQSGTVLFTYSGNLGAGEQVYLGDDIGLTLSFSAGNLRTQHTSSTAVTKTPITASGTAAFNAAPATRPRFEGGAVVTAGSFTVNGATITVAADDSIDSVISKINSSGAGVTASLANDEITLTTNGYSEDAITLADDTSGFLAATKLSGASTTTGNIRDDEQVLAKTSQFSTVTTGSFTVNGVSISVDKDTDTVSSLVNRINGAGAGVTATFNTTTNKIELTTTSISEDLITVAGDTTGFLTTAGLGTNNTVRGNIADDDQVFSKTSQFAAVVDGSFTINGVSISVDADQDSLQTVISQINASAAGVTAAYDAATDKLVLTPGGETLTLASDTSGFLTAAKVGTGTFADDANPDGAFNVTGASGPLFDSGVSVVAGSFEVNGVSIAVAADDTINAVLAKITASAAGVDATYDSATDTVRLVTRDVTEEPIVAGNDTSGFLAAVKLDGTAESSTGGETSPFAVELGDMDEYADVQAGTITVNGQQIAVDPETTTVNGLVSALNGLTNMSASLDEGTGRITIHSSLGGSITISDTSGLLSTLGLTAGTYTGVAGATTALRTQTGTEPSNTGEVVEHVSAAVEDLNTALSQLVAERPADSRMGADLASSLEEAVAVLQHMGVSGVGVAGGADPALSIDADALARSLDALAEPREARTAITGVVDALTEKMAERAGRKVEAAASRPSFTIELAALPVLDRAAAQARIESARKAARTSAYTKPPAPTEDRFGALSNQSPITARPVAAARTPYVKPGLFEGLFDSVLKYF